MAFLIFHRLSRQSWFPEIRPLHGEARTQWSAQAASRAPADERRGTDVWSGGCRSSVCAVPLLYWRGCSTPRRGGGAPPRGAVGYPRGSPGDGAHRAGADRWTPPTRHRTWPASCR
jgi:hypothetical protein